MAIYDTSNLEHMMQSSEIVVEPDPSRHFRSVTMGSNSRTRKCSLDQYSNTLLLDRNGNNTPFCRLASLSEDDNESSLNNMDNNGDTSDVTNEDTWKNAFITQIQNLLKDVNMSDNLSEKVYDEIMDKSVHNNASVKNRRSSCFTLTSTEYPKRRSSVTAKNIQNNNDFRGGRRMSHAGMTLLHPPTSGRRCSVAHLPSYGRRLSCSNNNFLLNQPNFLRQRRKSSAKPVTLNVTKVSSVQKQLHKIYKRRRRRDRASVNLDDVKSALRGPDYTEGGSDSDQEADTGDKENTNENNISAENWEDVTDDARTTNNDGEINFNDTQGTTDEGDALPAPRRRDSTQLRAWELSHKLRQRRRGRRQQSADF